ncbi:MAG TPA: SAM-dependent methyltransferase, partial [Pseudonocardiaceae bacterium]|jgi:uncharacterized protein YabN with tetrapyrrole methylase and pyrophosphatase domain
MRLPNDFTLEMLAVLKRCKRVFGIPPVRAPEFGLPEMENLGTLYGPDKSRQKTYREWLDLVLDAAAADAPVALATYGSAMVGALVTHRIIEEAPRRGLTVHVSNAISSIDGIWADFNIEPFYGFEIWEATTFVRLGIEPDTRTNLMLPQAPLFGVTNGPDPQNATMAVSSTVAALRDHLLRFYPADHEVHFVRTGSGVGPLSIRPNIETLPLAELDHPGGNTMSTLLIPRLGTHRGLDFDRQDQSKALTIAQN